MEWRVVKIGAEMFDALHACGLGILLACAINLPVKLEDEGITYRLHCSTRKLPDVTVEFLREILALPSIKTIQAVEKNRANINTAVANLDGVLAALFTTPGSRAVSVHDLLGKQRFDPAATRAGLQKGHWAVDRWVKYAAQNSHGLSAWLTDLLTDYDATHPQSPVPVDATKHTLNVVMSLDPAFTCSTHRPRSDGLVADKLNIAISQAAYAVLLAFIGAARFLRAQRVAGEMVDSYVPLAASMALRPETALPLLSRTDHAPDHALAFQQVQYWQLAQFSGWCWNGLAYQVMQTQRRQQSISRERGSLDNSWLTAIQECAGRPMIDSWNKLLNHHREQAPFEIDNLAICLVRHQVNDWLIHLRDVAMYIHSHPQAQVRPYTLQEVKEVTQAMAASTDAPLSAVLNREEGSLRFGHALRLLGNYNPASLRDLVDGLDSIQTCDQLLRLLAQVAQECAVASAKSQFIIVPCDDDLRGLLDDVDRYGARTVAGLLIILSSLRYPRAPDEEKEMPRPGSRGRKVK